MTYNFSERPVQDTPLVHSELGFMGVILIGSSSLITLFLIWYQEFIWVMVFVYFVVRIILISPQINSFCYLF